MHSQQDLEISTLHNMNAFIFQVDLTILHMATGSIYMKVNVSKISMYFKNIFYSP